MSNIVKDGDTLVLIPSKFGKSYLHFCFRDGVECRKNGGLKSDCPHPPRTSPYDHWLEGFNNTDPDREKGISLNSISATK